MTTDKTALDALRYIGTPMQAIEFALEQSVEACTFLEAWIHGDISEWPEYQPEESRPQPSGDAVKALDEVLKRYKNEIEYLESIKRTPFGDDALHTYKKFIGELEPVKAALTQPKADVEGLKKVFDQFKRENHYRGYTFDDFCNHLAAQGYIGVQEGYALAKIAFPNVKGSKEMIAVPVEFIMSDGSHKKLQYDVPEGIINNGTFRARSRELLGDKMAGDTFDDIVQQSIQAMIKAAPKKEV